MLTTVVGQTFHGTLASAPVDQTPQKEPANVVPGTSASLDLLRERQSKVDFPLMVPTVIERSSWIDRERPIRLYRFNDKGKDQKTVRLTYKMGSNDYWGVQQSNWDEAPVLGSRNFVRNIGGRRYELFYNGPRLHMVVLRQGGASYWVVNTLLDRLPNETMLAIAKGLRPVSKVTGLRNRTVGRGGYPPTVVSASPSTGRGLRCRVRRPRHRRLLRRARAHASSFVTSSPIASTRCNAVRSRSTSPASPS